METVEHQAYCNYHYERFVSRNNAYPDKAGDFDPERERDLDFDRDLAGERREVLAFGDLLHYSYKASMSLQLNSAKFLQFY